MEDEKDWLELDSVSRYVEFLASYSILVVVGAIVLSSLGFMGALLQAVYYVVVPLLVLMLVVLVYRVEEVLYHHYYTGELAWEHGFSPAGIVIGLVTGVAGLNLGLLLALRSAQQAVEGFNQVLVFGLMIIVLAFALSLSIVTRELVSSV